MATTGPLLQSHIYIDAVAKSSHIYITRRNLVFPTKSCPLPDSPDDRWRAREVVADLYNKQNRKRA